MSKEHPNIKVLERLDLTNLEASAEIIADDFIWHYYNPELLDLEGDYPGLSGLMNFFNKIGVLTGGSFKVDHIASCPLGDNLVVTLVEDTMILEGKPMKIEAVVIWCIMNGKIKEAWDIPVIETATILESEHETS